MGILKPRHERFCRHFVDCMNATVAAKAAGYSPSSARNAGYRLLRQPRIVRRIIELQTETAVTHCRDVNVLLGKLETIYRRAVDDRQLSAATRAVELQAKLSGVAPTGPPNRRPDGGEPCGAEPCEAEWCVGDAEPSPAGIPGAYDAADDLPRDGTLIARALNVAAAACDPASREDRKQPIAQSPGTNPVIGDFDIGDLDIGDLGPDVARG